MIKYEEYSDEQVKDIKKSDFEFIQRDEKVYDKKFETKPIGYFKDAMIRFAKNRVNVVATLILVTLILLSVFVPILTTKNYDVLETQLTYLPPRVPLLERLGILDGSRYLEDQTVDRATIGTIEGYPELGLPLNRDPEFIDMDTLKNYSIPCSDLDDRCYGGEVRMSLGNTTFLTMRSSTVFEFDPEFDPTVTVTIDDIFAEDNTFVNVMISLDGGLTFELLGTMDEVGTEEFEVFHPMFLHEDVIESYVYLQLNSDLSNGWVHFLSVTVDDTSSDDVIRHDQGFSLHSYTVTEGNGRRSRINGELLFASFKWDPYRAAFGERYESAFSAERFYALIEENQDKCGLVEGDMSVAPTAENPWVFAEGCSVTRVVGRTEIVIGPGGSQHYSYSLYQDFMISRGYSSIPYFFFGTTQGGRDLFALTWVGLRTSLTIGIIVSFINITVGIIYGSISGYYGGKVDLLMERFSEVISRIPWLVTLSIFMALIGPGALTLILVLIVSGWIGVSSVTRTQFYRYKGREYVLASRTLGAKDSRLIFRHILPNGIGTIITASVLMIPMVMFTEAALSYLGFGIGHGQSFRVLGIELSGVSVGVLLSDGRTEMMTRPYLTLYPAIIISILMITFNMFGNALRDAFNPSLRGSE